MGAKQGDADILKKRVQRQNEEGAVCICEQTYSQQVENVEKQLQRYEKQNRTRRCNLITSQYEDVTVWNGAVSRWSIMWPWRNAGLEGNILHAAYANTPATGILSQSEWTWQPDYLPSVVNPRWVDPDGVKPGATRSHIPYTATRCPTWFSDLLSLISNLSRCLGASMRTRTPLHSSILKTTLSYLGWQMSVCLH